MEIRARILALSVLVAGGSACCSDAGKGSGAAVLAPGVLVFVANDGKSAVTPPDWQGIVIEIDSTVRYEATLRATGMGGDQEFATLDGHPFEVRGGEIHIGPSTYGPVRVGDRVAITSEGVRVNGELLGPLP